MLRYFKLSIAQLLCLTAIAGSIFFLATFDRNEPFWREDLLPYEVPNVPRSFELISEQPIVVKASRTSTTSTFEYPNGQILYLDGHQQGWEQIRRLFYGGNEWLEDVETFDFYEDYDYSKLSFREPYEIHSLAKWEGSQRCREQLTKLLETTSSADLRPKSHTLHPGPSCLR